MANLRWFFSQTLLRQVKPFSGPCREESWVCVCLSGAVRSGGSCTHRLVGFVWKQGKRSSAATSVMSGSHPSVKKAPPLRTGSPDPQLSVTWCEVRTTFEGAGAISTRICTAAPPFPSRRKGPRRNQPPPLPRHLLGSLPCWSAGSLASSC